MRFRYLRVISADILAGTRNLEHWHNSDVCEPVWFELDAVIDTVEFYIFCTYLSDLDLHLRSQVCKKAKSTPIVSQSSLSNWMEYGVLLRLAGLMNPILILSQFSCSHCSIERNIPL